MEPRKVTGVIFSDLGKAASFMALDWVQKILREKLGFSPYPATLNLRLESDEEIGVWREVKRQGTSVDLISPDPFFCQARCFPVMIEKKYEGAVLLPDVAGYPADKIEVIAAVRLKEELRVRDGDRITLEFID
ncbi:MAG: DUF120 domain-containing protein [Candidatus Binatia bacterium]